MELRPDNRHLVGGVVAALLATAYLAWAGMGQPGPAYYEPEFDAHTGGRYDEIKCSDCHRPFKPAADADCIACHDHRELAAALRLSAEKLVRPDLSASLVMHGLVKDQACGTCHVEHRSTDLGVVLKLPKAERHAAKGFYRAVHDPLPEALQGEANCAKCHTPEELTGAAGAGHSEGASDASAPEPEISPTPTPEPAPAETPTPEPTPAPTEAKSKAKRSSKK